MATVAVEVSTNGVDYTSSGVRFRYRKPAYVLSLRPRSGPETGGTKVTVVGMNFVDSAALRCRGSEASPTDRRVGAGGADAACAQGVGGLRGNACPCRRRI